MSAQRLDEIAHKISSSLEEMDKARDQGLLLHRRVIKESSLAIRAIHRSEFDVAERHLGKAQALLTETHDLLEKHPCIYHAGFLQDAQKEYAEARITMAIVQDRPIPYPEEVGIDDVAYLKGLAEAVGELRRHILDRIRLGELEKGEKTLAIMDDIYYMLITMDFPDALTRGLRRSTDVARGCLERTRGDLTNHLSQLKLDKGIEYLKSRLAELEPASP